MRTPAGLPVPLAALAAVMAAGSAAAAEPTATAGADAPAAETVAPARVGTERTAGAPVGEPGIATAAGNAAPTRSRLLRSLSEQAEVPEAEGAATAPGLRPAGMPAGSVLHGCPRALLGALFAGAAEGGDAVSALAIERETLALCRERQEIVNGIVALENELGVLRAAAEVADAAVPRESSIVTESGPVAVVRLLESPEEQAEPSAPDDAPPSPAYSWFSIIGSAGDLRAGVSDGGRAWFVREGDRLPGGITIEGIDVRPPGVRAAGGETSALPYRPRPDGAATSGAAGPGGGP